MSSCAGFQQFAADPSRYAVNALRTTSTEEAGVGAGDRAAAGRDPASGTAGAPRGTTVEVAYGPYIG